MKINEIITEASQMPKSHTDATPGMKSHDGLDNSSPYAPWRFAATFLPGSPDFDHEPEKQGPVGQALVTVAYSDAEHEIIDAAERKFGATSRRISPNGSSENPEIQNLSPTRKVGAIVLNKKK